VSPAAAAAAIRSEGRLAVAAQREAGSGYTVLEVLVVLAVIGALVAIFAPGFVEQFREAKIRRAVLDIRILSAEIRAWGAGQDFPDSLAEIESGSKVDPWGRPYAYLRIEDSNRGQWRKDRFLVPLNSDYDLYSLGPNGRSQAPLTAAVSRDDIVRAGDGAYVGPAEDY
jgi:general secretion pathway protein G